MSSANVQNESLPSVSDVLNSLEPKLRPEIVSFMENFYFSDAPHEHDFNLFRYIPSNEVAYIDAGANIGLSALSMKKCAPAALGYGFEANTQLEPALTLASRHCCNYVYKMVGLSDCQTQGNLIIPLVDCYAEYGEASFSKENFQKYHVIDRLKSYTKSNALEFLDYSVYFEKLDDQFVALDMLNSREFRVIKIDVEGHELAVILGGREFIKNSKAAILIEEGNRIEIVRALGELGYRPFQVDPNLSIQKLSDVPTLNTLFLNCDNAKLLSMYTGQLIDF